MLFIDKRSKLEYPKVSTSKQGKESKNLTHMFLRRIPGFEPRPQTKTAKDPCTNLELMIND